MAVTEHRFDATPFLPERKSLQALRDAAASGSAFAPERFDAADIRRTMAQRHGLAEFADLMQPASHEEPVESDMHLVEL